MKIYFCDTFIVLVIIIIVVVPHRFASLPLLLVLMLGPGRGGTNASGQFAEHVYGLLQVILPITGDAVAGLP
jgi:hypothetical protein